jgi:hypothetical protein
LSRGKLHESKKNLLKRFEEKHGKIDHLTRFQGIMSAAEAAATLTDAQMS